jgi:hypothetical protein
MLSYPYIESLFKAVLAQSFVMQGHFHTCPHFGGELNTGNMEEVLIQSLGTDYKKKIYPLTLMLPPRSSGDYTNDYFKDEYDIVLYFLTTTFYTARNQIKTLNPDSLVSQHPIVFDWHDMKRCAVKFLKALQEVAGITGTFYVKEGERPYISPISTIGTDRVSGVMVSFVFSLGESCTDEDYPVDFLSKIQLPDATDIHPEHLQ